MAVFIENPLEQKFFRDLLQRSFQGVLQVLELYQDTLILSVFSLLCISKSFPR